LENCFLSRSVHRYPKDQELTVRANALQYH